MYALQHSSSSGNAQCAPMRTHARPCAPMAFPIGCPEIVRVWRQRGLPRHRLTRLQDFVGSISFRGLVGMCGRAPGTCRPSRRYRACRLRPSASGRLPAAAMSPKHYTANTDTSSLLIVASTDCPDGSFRRLTYRGSEQDQIPT